MKRPLVSILVITYNHEKYIKKALDSILEQNIDFSYEILIGDDCSSDNTEKIINLYLNKYNNIKYFRNKTNLGATENAINLLKRARGIYLATCEGDDFWVDKDKLKKQIYFLEKHPEIVGCAHDCMIVDEKNIVKKIPNLLWIKKKKIFSLKDFRGIYLPGQPSTYVRRNLVFDKKIDVDYVTLVHPYIGDRTLMLLYLLNGDFAFINEKMSCYRKVTNGKSITNVLYKNHYQALKQDYDITCKLEKIAKTFNKNVDFREFKSQILLKAIVFYLKEQDKRFIKLIKKISSSMPINLKIMYYFFCYLGKMIDYVVRGMLNEIFTYNITK